MPKTPDYFAGRTIVITGADVDIAGHIAYGGDNAAKPASK